MNFLDKFTVKTLKQKSGFPGTVGVSSLSDFRTQQLQTAILNKERIERDKQEAGCLGMETAGNMLRIVMFFLNVISIRRAGLVRVIYGCEL